MVDRSVFQHFRPEEAFLVERFQDLGRQVEDQYRLHLTEFLDPRQLEIARNILAGYSVQVFSSSDFWQSEYARLVIAPDYYELDLADFELALLEINYHRKFNQLSHRQILGALLNQLGLKRSVLGDIILTEDVAQVLVDRAKLAYLQEMVTKIGRAKVHLKEVPLSQLVRAQDSGEKDLLLVSSLRLDKLVAAVCHLSRDKASHLIATEKVKRNYSLTTKPAEQTLVGDLISVRGFGRFRLLEDQGQTKNGKHKLIIERLTTVK